MSEKRVVQWLGMICLLAGISRMGMTPTSIIWGTDSSPELIFGFVASILMSVGTIATFIVQSRETGMIGFITVLAVIIGNIATTCMLWSSFPSVDTSLKPDGVAYQTLHMLVVIGFTGGTLLFTFLTYRAHVFPRWIITLLVLMLLSMVLPIEDNKYFAFFWGLAYVGMGYAIWSDKLNSSEKTYK
ncbi:hypothetical protein [Paenibacillus sp. UNC451MF]|uniref:hypothetical protein n=1 Tax=Paenibacillus sp. UNC451MF TaxID=1449063 RepID=UPI00049052CA|nr:hypothetical protein [Paenibacillus sp. UNC451MF]